MSESKKLSNIEINKCALCFDAPCKKLYKNIDSERIIRALKLIIEKVLEH